MPGHWSNVMGGAQYQVKCIAEKVSRMDKYKLFYVTKFVDKDYQPDNYHIAVVNKYKKKNSWRIFRDATSIYRRLKTIQPDVIYQRIGCAYTGIGAYYAKKNHCKMIWHISHDMDVSRHIRFFSRRLFYNFFDKKLLEYGIRNVNHIIAQTKEQALLLKQNYNRQPDLIIKNFHPTPTVKAEKTKNIRVLWVANIKPWKQPEHFIRLAQSVKSHRAVEFVMIGKMQGNHKYKNLLLDLVNQTPNLTYVGECPQDDVNQIIGSSHILVNTSKYEGFSNTFVQAWMRRVPVVSLTVNPDGIFNQNQVGMLAGTFVQLLQDVTLLIENDQLRSQMGANAKAYAMSHHSLKNIDALVELFDAS